MANKKTDMKDRIIASAFTLFSVYGFSATTIEQIIEKAGCSKGTFYHYFPGKASILRSWIDVMDMDYQKWYEECDKELPALEQLGLFNDYILSKLENFADLETLSTIYAFQLNLEEDQQFWKTNRQLNTVLSAILRSGQQRGEIRNDISFVELSKMYLTVHRGILYEWCISKGTYSFKEYGNKLMSMFLPSFASQNVI